jgi:hypothetical protein
MMPGAPRAVLRVLLATAIASAFAAASGPARTYAQADVDVPETGTPAERLKKLWHDTRPHLLADAKAALSDAEYQKRRAPIWGAWIQLQMSVAGDDDQVERIIPDVLGLLNRIYGWTADSPAKRQENRDESRPFTEKRVAEMDKRVAAVK